ncbi:MAG: citrate synthase family protein [Chloroflexi bacterium]|nr:citrate synthase family protein [Chloroflexota bacterium]
MDDSVKAAPPQSQLGRRWLSVAEVAARLRIKPATVYAYVSRGLLRSETGSDGRASRFDVAQVERLATKGRRARGLERPDLVVESALTAITGERYYYRGRDALRLAGTQPFEAVAQWLWTGGFGDATPWEASAEAIRVGVDAQAPLPPDTLPLDRLRVIASAVATVDELRYDTSPEGVVGTARRLLVSLVECLPEGGGRAAGSQRTSPPGGRPEPLARRLGRALGLAELTPARVDLLNTALVLLADHELSASTLAARVAASLQAEPYAVVSAGLGAISGPRHGGAVLKVEGLLAQIGQTADVGRVVGNYLRRGEALPGFGHPLYSGIDPRADLLLRLLGTVEVDPERLAGLQAVRDRSPVPPNVDFGLAGLAYALELVRGAGEAIFAAARTAGWIAHALEEYAAPTPFRLRALYTGPEPQQG